MKSYEKNMESRMEGFWYVMSGIENLYAWWYALDGEGLELCDSNCQDAEFWHNIFMILFSERVLAFLKSLDKSVLLGGLFQKETGQSLSDYMQKKKIEHAVFLLKNSRMSVWDIAAELHYSSPSHFCTFFDHVAVKPNRQPHVIRHGSVHLPCHHFYHLHFFTLRHFYAFVRPLGDGPHDYVTFLGGHQVAAFPPVSLIGRIYHGVRRICFLNYDTTFVLIYMHFVHIYIYVCKIYLTYQWNGGILSVVGKKEAGDDMARNIAIKVARAEKDMTQKALAEAVGISRQTMNAIEQGDYNPSIRLCRSICRVLGKGLDDLFWKDQEDDDDEET